MDRAGAEERSSIELVLAKPEGACGRFCAVMGDAHVKIMCPSLTCRKVLSVPAIARGKTVRCKSCGTVIRIPEKPAAAQERPVAPKDAAVPASGKPKDKAA